MRLGDLAEQVENRHVHGDDDAADHDPEEQYHYRLEQGHQVFYRLVHLVLVEIGDLREHGVEGAGLLADADHLHHHGRKDAGLLQRAGDGLSLLDALARGHDGVLDDRVPGGPGGDLETFQDRHARLYQGAERAAEAGHGDLAHEVAQHWDPQDELIDLPSPLVGLVVTI